MPPACRSPCPAAGSPSRWHTAPLAPERPRPGAVTGLRPRPPRGTEGSGRAELLTDPRSGERLRADGSPLSGHLLPLPLPRTRAARGCAGHRVASSRPVWQPCPAQPCGGPRPAARTPQGSPARAATARGWPSGSWEAARTPASDLSLQVCAAVGSPAAEAALAGASAPTCALRRSPAHVAAPQAGGAEGRAPVAPPHPLDRGPPSSVHAR